MVQWSEARPACRSNRSSGPIGVPSARSVSGGRSDERREFGRAAGHAARSMGTRRVLTDRKCQENKKPRLREALGEERRLGRISPP
jgi:hypothetical protein